MSGTFVGASLKGSICAGGAFAFLESSIASTAPGQLILVIDKALSVASGSPFTFETPADATAGELTILAGIPAASPGS